MIEAVLYGRAQFRFELTTKTIERNGKTQQVPQLKLSVDQSSKFDEKLKCRYHKRYCAIMNDARDFMSNFIDINEEREGERVWDHANAARYLKGLIMNFNYEAEHSAGSSYAKIDLTQGRAVHLLLGCTRTQIDETIKRPI